MCLKVFTSPMEIHQCSYGHFTCEPCRNKMEVRKGLKKSCKIHFLGGSHRGSFSTFIFFLWGGEVPNGLKINIRHWNCIEGVPPSLGFICHRHILKWQYQVKAKIACVLDKITLVAAIIACGAAKSGIWGAKNCLVQNSFGIFNGENYTLYKMV